MGETVGVAIVTVHGTNDSAPESDGVKWFQCGSEFATRLTALLAQRGLEAVIEPFLWGGANSAQARSRAADALARTIRKHAKAGRDVHVVSHSHGGNVANQAACLLNWRGSPRRPQPLKSVTTVGTPFFKGLLSPGESMGAIAFLIVLITSVLALSVVTPLALTGLRERESDLRQELMQLLDEGQLTPEQAIQLAQVLEGDAMSEQPATLEGAGGAPAAGGQAPAADAERFAFVRTLSRAVLYCAPISLLSLLFVFPVAWRGWRRIQLLRRKRNESASVFSIWHGNDEAIAFLGGIERVAIEPFPPGALARTARTAGVLWGVRATLLIVGLAFLLLLLGVWLVTRGGAAENDLLRLLGGAARAPQGFHLLTAAEWPLYVAAAGIIAAPILFGAVYLIIRAVAWLVGENIMRKRLNALVTGAVQGVAFGRDNDERFGEVATCSPTFAARDHKLDGEVSERMSAAATKAANDLLARYRWKLFSVGADNKDAMRDIAVDAMTWDSLIHTTYFDQPEVVALIAEHIAAESRR